jgi:hypothetical protein
MLVTSFVYIIIASELQVKAAEDTQSTEYRSETCENVFDATESNNFLSILCLHRVNVYFLLLFVFTLTFPTF